MINFMLIASACGIISGSGISIGYGGAFAKDWLQINALLVLFIVLISSVLYALSSLLPPSKRERLRSIIRYEFFEAFLSLVIIFIILALSSTMCTVSADLSNSPTFPGTFYSDELYIGNLLFNKGAILVSQLYMTSIEYGIAEEVAEYVFPFVFNLLGMLPVMPALSPDYTGIYSAFADLFIGLYAGLVLAVFGVLFVLFLFLPVIQAISLTVILPVAIATRSLAFTGPKLREVSNTFIALAIGFFFVLPATLSFDQYIAGCLSMISGKPSSCTWLTQQDLSYLKITPMPVSTSSLFTSTSQSLTSAPQLFIFGTYPISASFFSSILSSGAAPGFSSLTLIINAPSIALSYGDIIAQYIFLGIVLIAIDFGITMGFVAGLARGLNAVSGLMETGPLW